MNKIGLHIIGGWNGNLGRPRLVKLVNVSLEYVRQVRAEIGPQALIIVRWVQDNQPLDNPAARAQQFVARYQGEMLAMRQSAGAEIAFEGYNEVPDGQANAYCAFEAERLRLMRNLGLRSVIGNFAVGTPDLPIWAAYRPMLRVMEPGDLLGLHEYWVDQFDIGNRWHCGRWTLVPELTTVPIVVTECGRDTVEGRGVPGWRQTCDANQFRSDLWAYDGLLEQFSNVLGATVFTVGNDPKWQSFDLSPIWPQVVAGYSNPQIYPSVSISEPTGPDMTLPYWHSDRHGYKPEWIIIHDTEGPADAALVWWRSWQNTARSSVHYLVRADGEVIPVVPEQYASHHAGGGKWPGIPEGSVNGTSIINLVSIGVELEYPAAPASPLWPQVQVDAAVRLVADIARCYNIPRERILRHLDVDPANRSDPRNFDWAMFLARVMAEADRMNEEQIRNAAWQALGIPYNPDAAFPRYAREHGLGNPVTREIDVVGYRLQGYSDAIVYAKVDDWGNVRHMSW